MDYFSDVIVKINPFHQFRFNELWNEQPYLRLNLFMRTAVRWDIKADADLKEVERILVRAGIKHEFVREG